MANIVITTHWTDGDVLPFIKIGSELRKRGHRVTLITHCYYKNMAKSQGLDFEAWDSPEQHRQMLEDMKEELDPLRNPCALERYKKKYESIEVRLREFKKVIAHCNTTDTVLVAKNRSSVAAYLAAEKLNIPLVCVFMAPSEMLSMVSYEMMLGKLLANELNLLRKELNLAPVKSWLAWQSSPKRQIALWPDWFAEPIKEWPAEVINVGFPLSYNERFDNLPPDLMEDLLGDEPPVVITGGTSKTIRPEFYPLCVETCRLSGRKGILVTRYEELLPKELPDKVKWFRELPLNKIFPYTSAVIHHGGMGTLSGAIAAGVPQLVLPYYLDRPYNALCLKKLGIAEYLPPIKWKPEIMVDALQKITASSFRERCKLFSKKVSLQNTMNEICCLIEETVNNEEFLLKDISLLQTT